MHVRVDEAPRVAADKGGTGGRGTLRQLWRTASTYRRSALLACLFCCIACGVVLRGAARSVQAAPWQVVSVQDELVEHAAVSTVSVVFFMNLYPPARLQWSAHMRAWMSKLASSGLLSIADLTVVVSGDEPSDVSAVLLQCEDVLPASANVTLEASQDNAFEYPGIHRLWQEAVDHPDRILLYFHSKGITHDRPALEYFDEVVAPWRHVLEVFATRPEVDKVGVSCSGLGWVWYNFWWVRARYARNAVEPLRVERRHYYEDWLGRSNPLPACRADSVPDHCWDGQRGNCLSLIAPGNGTDRWYDAQNAGGNLGGAGALAPSFVVVGVLALAAALTVVQPSRF